MRIVSGKTKRQVYQSVIERSVLQAGGSVTAADRLPPSVAPLRLRLPPRALRPELPTARQILHFALCTLISDRDRTACEPTQRPMQASI